MNFVKLIDPITRKYAVGLLHEDRVLVQYGWFVHEVNADDIIYWLKNRKSRPGRKRKEN